MRPPSTPTPAAQAESTRLRLTFLALLIVSLFVLLLARLWFLQVMAGASYADAAQTNAVREVPVEAPRGRILTRDGEPLVDNRYAMVVSVAPEEMGERKSEVMTDLADLLGITLEQMEERIARSRVSALRPKPVAIDVPQDVAFYIHENASTRYPGVYAESLPRRSYPEDDLAAHLLGYVGEISDAELAQAEYEGYRPGELIGWAGLERSYEPVLRGVEGKRRLEVSRQNEVVGELPEILPEPGADLVTAIDLDAQRLAEASLAEGIAKAQGVGHRESGRTLAAPAGAVVVLDPRNGEIRAMASYPTYDPDQFVGGVGEEYWAWLQDEANEFPLINRAIQASYPPGSVWKVVSASAALNRGFMTQDSQLPCPGAWKWGPQTFRNWTRVGEAAMNLQRSLVRSCDPVYYELARQMWLSEQSAAEAGGPVLEALSAEAEAWGFGKPLGIDLPGERGGVVPGRTWKQEYWESARDTYCQKGATLPPGSYAQAVNADLCENGNRWRGGDAVNMSIGQGDVQVTPLQIASAFAAIANGGTVYQPRVAHEVVRSDGSRDPVEPEVLSTLPTSPADLAYLEGGLVGVTSGPGGTAAGVFGDFPIRIAGKTGTAELKPKQPFAWFAGYNVDPIGGEEYVVVAMVEQGGGGSQTAAPIVKKVFSGLFGLGDAEITTGEATD